MLIASIAHLGLSAQNVPLPLNPNVRIRGRNIVISDRGKDHLLKVGQSIDAAKLDEAKVIFASRRPDFIYLLINACGPSKLKPDARQCGAGDECNLLWLKLNIDWVIVDSKSIRYESCWSTVTSTDGPQIKGNALKLDYDDFSNNKHFNLTYNGDRPEQGIKVEESVIKDGTD
jgi:hypothetical protein